MTEKRHQQFLGPFQSGKKTRMEKLLQEEAKLGSCLYIVHSKKDLELIHRDKSFLFKEKNIKIITMREFFLRDFEAQGIEYKKYDKDSYWLKHGAETSIWKNIEYIYIADYQNYILDHLKVLLKLFENNPEVKIRISGSEDFRLVRKIKIKDIGAIENFCKRNGGLLKINSTGIFHSPVPLIHFMSRILRRGKLPGYEQFIGIDSGEVDESLEKHLEVRYFGAGVEIEPKIKLLISNYSAQLKILIVTLSIREFKKYAHLEKGFPNVKVISVNEVRGHFDVVIIPHQVFNEVRDIDSVNRWAKAISRASGKVYIFSRFPQKTMEGILGDECIALNTQIMIPEPKFDPMIIRQRPDFARMKILCSREDRIDSLVFSVEWDKVPYLATLKRNVKLQPFVTEQRMDLGILENCSIRYGWGQVWFFFNDLNNFRRLEFINLFIVEAIRDILQDYYGYLEVDAWIDRVRVRRLDIARERPYDILKMQELLYNLGPMASNHKKGNPGKKIQKAEDKNDPQNFTLYYNQNKKKLRLYDPVKKKVNAVSSDRSISKLEVSLHKKLSELSFFNLELLLQDNMDMSGKANMNITNIYTGAISDLFPFLKKKPVKNIEREKSKLGISNITEAVEMMENPPKSPRDRRKLFSIYLSFLDKEIVDNFLDLLGFSFGGQRIIKDEGRNVHSSKNTDEIVPLPRF